jgi:AcrR family transcriptional regulator
MGDTKARILDATATFFRRQGYGGTSMKQILATAHAPFASLYHFFPGGKEELGGEVIRRSGRLYGELFEIVMDASPDVASGVGSFFDGAAETLRQTDYTDACPIATVALEVASTSEPLRLATAEVFESWIDAAAARFTGAGIARGQSRTLAVSMLAALEGAFVLSRALRSTEPLEITGAAAAAAVRAALPPRAPPKTRRDRRKSAAASRASR